MTAMIKGAKGGSKKQRAPREAPDSLVSIAYARLVDLVSEGEIEGLVNGESSIYLDETPAGSGAFPDSAGSSATARRIRAICRGSRKSRTRSAWALSCVLMLRGFARSQTLICLRCASTSPSLD